MCPAGSLADAIERHVSGCILGACRDGEALARVGRSLDARAGRRGSAARRDGHAGKRVGKGPGIRNIDARGLVYAVFRTSARQRGAARERACARADAARATTSRRYGAIAPPLPAFARRGAGGILTAAALHVVAVAVGGRADAGQAAVGRLHAARSVAAGGARRAAHPFPVFARGAAGGLPGATAIEIASVATGGSTLAVALGERIGAAAPACCDGERYGGRERQPESGAHRRGPRLSNTCACAFREQSRANRGPVRARLGHSRAVVSAYSHRCGALMLGIRAARARKPTERAVARPLLSSALHASR